VASFSSTSTAKSKEDQKEINADPDAEKVSIGKVKMTGPSFERAIGEETTSGRGHEKAPTETRPDGYQQSQVP
jgi:hypothetical protein